MEQRTSTQQIKPKTHDDESFFAPKGSRIVPIQPAGSIVPVDYEVGIALIFGLPLSVLRMLTLAVFAALSAPAAVTQGGSACDGDLRYSSHGGAGNSKGDS
jgi:hypothetical protein